MVDDERVFLLGEDIGGSRSRSGSKGSGTGSARG
jgi:hypothetical protein